MDEAATLNELKAEFVDATNTSGRYACLVRDTEAQAEHADLLENLKDRLKAFKYGAIEKHDEYASNKLFQMQCRLNASACFLRMWCCLKNHEYYKAWDYLIDAQEYISYAMRAEDDDLDLGSFMKHLTRTERVVFPGYARYQSVCITVKGGVCTVCGECFTTCPHVEGLVYWGRLCRRVHPEIVSVDHTALVKNPRDRRCIFTEVETDGGIFRDYMTWGITKQSEPAKDGSARFTGRLLSNRLLDVT